MESCAGKGGGDKKHKELLTPTRKKVREVEEIPKRFPGRTVHEVPADDEGVQSRPWSSMLQVCGRLRLARIRGEQHCRLRDAERLMRLKTCTGSSRKSETSDLWHERRRCERLSTKLFP